MSMKKWVKRGISLMLAGTMIMGLTGCGDKQGTDPATKLAAKQNVYKYEDLGLLPSERQMDSWTGLNGLSYKNDRVYALVTEEQYSEENYSRSTKLVSVNLDGSEKQEAVIYKVDPKEGGIDGNMGRMVLTDNFLYATFEAWDYENMDENGNAPRTMDLICWNLNGEEQWRQSLLPEDETEAQSFWVQYMIGLDNDQLLVMSETSMNIYDNAGQQISRVPFSLSEISYNSIYMGKDGNLMITIWNEDWTKISLATLNIQTGEMSEPQELPFKVNNYNVIASKNYDMLLSNSSGIYGYKNGDTEPTPIMNYVNSDLATDGLNNIVEISDTQFVASYNDMENWQQHVGIFTYVDPADIPDKEVITLASMYTDSEMKNRIAEFNKTSEKYRIMLKEYNQYNSAEDYMGGYTQMNADIVAGNMPDILVVDDNMPISSYISKGLLADLYDFIDKDEEFNREDFLQNVFDAYSVDGKLYTMVPSFQVWTVLGKTADVGTERGWTMQDLQNVMASKPEGTSIFGEETSRDSIMWYATMMALPQFMNMETGECNFDSQGFMDLLAFLKEFPTEIDPSIWEDPESWEKRESQYREGRTLLQTASISQAQDMIYNIRATWGEPITYIGFPTAEGEGSVIIPNSRFAISAKSKCKEGAWEFLRYYLTDEYQEKVYSMPVSKEMWEKQTRKAMEKRLWVDETTGETHYEDYTMWVGDQQIVIDPLSQEEVDAFKDFVLSVNKTQYYDQSIIDIINEEAAPYYEGQKSVEEVAEIIQSRIQIYVDETR